MTDRAPPLNPSRTYRKLPFSLAGGLAACIFLIDLMTPLGVGEWIAYLIPVLIASRSANAKHLVWLSSALTLLAILGFIGSHPGVVPTELAAVNRALGVGVLWVATALIVQRVRAERKQARLEAALRRSEIMSALGSLVVAVAHEVRNPVFGISATLDALEARFGPAPAFAEYFKVLRTEVNRMTQLTRDLLEYGKPRRLAPVSTAIADIIADAVATCARQAKDAGVEITTRMGREALTVRADPERLRQLFENLIQNAIQHSRRGGVVAVEADEVRRGGDAWVRCNVIDLGEGFRPEDLPRVFEPFFTRRPGGTGLGLSIAQRIVEEHGGTISAQNDPAGGARIEIGLPAGV